MVRRTATTTGTDAPTITARLLPVRHKNFAIIKCHKKQKASSVQLQVDTSKVKLRKDNLFAKDNFRVSLLFPSDNIVYISSLTLDTHTHTCTHSAP